MAIAAPMQEEHIAQAARQYLAAFGAFVHGVQPRGHHMGWIRDLVRIGDEGGKLLVVAFPGAAKSTWVMIFIEWFLGNHPDHSVLFLTSSDSMANKFNTAIRAMMESERYALVFPDTACRPDKDRGWSGEGLWLKGTPADSKDPAFRAAGFGSSIIGTRPHMVVMDDPLTQEQAQSETEQPKAHTYHDATVTTRLRPGTRREIFITTRWADNDLAGHVLKQSGWLSRNVPALDERDESVWPEQFPTELLHQIRTDIGTAQFRCVYQGDPTSLGGSVFREEGWFRPLPADFDRRALGPSLPGEAIKRTRREQLNVVQFWDFAYSERETADFSACVTLGVDQAQNFYVIGLWEKRLDEADLETAMIEQWEMHQPHVIGVERGIWDKFVVVRDLVGRVRRKIPAAILTITAKGDKVARARLPAARAEAGQLYLDEGLPQAHAFKAECLGFPLAAHDDFVDALSGASELAATRMAYWEPETTERQKYTFRGAA